MMKRENVLKSVSSAVGLSKEDNLLLINFMKENEGIEDSEFYKKMNLTFPWLEFRFKINEATRLSKIEGHLNFLKVLVIVLLILGIISSIAMAV